MDPKRVASTDNWPRPVTAKTFQPFLNFTNFYCTFILNCKTTVLLLSLVGKNVPSNWSIHCTKVSVLLKNALKLAHVLHYPDSPKTFIVETDASDNVIEGVLSQECKNGLCH